MADGMKAKATYGAIPPLFDRFPRQQHVTQLTADKLADASRRLKAGSPPLHTTVINPEDFNDHLRDAMLYGRGQTSTRAPEPATLESYSDAEMVMEMLRRGYAVVKSKDGDMPEVLNEG